MRELRCDDCREVLAEVALGIADAQERAAALSHLDRCRRCRTELRGLSDVADGLGTLLPPAEPPIGFESRVMAAVGKAGAAARPTGRRHHPVRVAIAALAAAAVGIGAWTADVHLAASRARTPTVLTAALWSGRRDVGRVVVAGRPRPWMSLTVDAGIGRAEVRCEVIGPGGATVTVGTFWITGGNGYWAAPLRTHMAVRGARLVSTDGRVLAAATLGAGT